MMTAVNNSELSEYDPYHGAMAQADLTGSEDALLKVSAHGQPNFQKRSRMEGYKMHEYDPLSPGCSYFLEEAD